MDAYRLDKLGAWIVKFLFALILCFNCDGVRCFFPFYLNEKKFLKECFF